MKRRTKEAWRALVSGQAGSGLTVQAYCRRERICTASFYRWRGILGTALMPSPVAEHWASPASSPPAFVDLGTLRPEHRVELRLEFGGGIVLSIARS